MIKKFIIKGLVQGIGYRPWIAKIAEELNINGTVRNTGGIVTVVAAGDEESLSKFFRIITQDVPTGGFVSSIEEEPVDSYESKGFLIIPSERDIQENLPLIPPDIATCDKCKQELFDKNNRRYHHPFISCTVCGPRYSIIERLPYDRGTITMSDFEMCSDCATEYTG